jgi:hypothetical protein
VHTSRRTPTILFSETGHLVWIRVCDQTFRLRVEVTSIFFRSVLHMKRILSAVLFTVLFLSGAASLRAQGIITGTVAGTVTDPGGALIPGATVTIKNADTGLTIVRTTKADGDFDFSALPTGKYSLKIASPNFETKEVGPIYVTVGPSDLGKVALGVGPASATVEVSETAPLLETTEAQISNNFGLSQVQDLPTNGGFDQLALLSPGVVQTHDGGFSNNNGASFSSNGQRGRSNNFEIDGQTNNDNSVAGPQLFFGNQDALQGIQVVTDSFSAQYGHDLGSVVNYLTRAGVNHFHGALYEFNEGNWGESFNQGSKSPFFGFCAAGQTTAADGCVTPTLPRYVENKFGGAFSGPLLKDKLFFSTGVNFDRTHIGGGASLSGQTTLTPTPAGLLTLQSLYPNSAAVNSLVTAGPYSVKIGNPTPYNVQDIMVTGPDGVAHSVEFGSIQRSVPSQTNDEEILGRLDYQPTVKDHFFLRYIYQDDPTKNALGVGAATALGKWYDVPDTAHSVGADITHTFSSQWVDQLRYGFQQTNLTFQGGSVPGCTITNAGVCPTPISIGGTFACVRLDGTSTTCGNGSFGTDASNIPQGRIVKVTQVQNNATYVKGKHSIIFGGEYDYQNSPNGFLPYYDGSVSFGSFGSLLSQSGTYGLASGNFTIPFKENDVAAYFQDDWKILSNLTLNLGMRWEYYQPASNTLHNETVARESNPATAIFNTADSLASRTVNAVANKYTGFEPRIGFAYVPDMFGHRVVVRGGFAINEDPEFYNIFLNVASSTPVVLLSTGQQCAGTCLNGGPTGSGFRAQNLPVIQGSSHPDPGKFTQTQLTPNFQNPYAESYNLGVEWSPTNKVVLDAHYVGNHSVKLFQSLNANPSLPDASAAYPNVINPSLFCTTAGSYGLGRTNCNDNIIRLRANTASSNYESLQLELTTQNYHGLSSTLAYTRSKTMDNASEIFGTFGGGNTSAFAQNPFDTSYGEYGLSGIDVPNVVSASFVYKVPFFEKQNTLVSRLLGGFQANGIYTYDSGNTVTPYNFEYDYYYGSGPGFNVAQYCDEVFGVAENSSVSTCRPYLSNPKVKLGPGSVGILDTDGQYYELQDYLNNGGVAGGGTATPTAASNFHLLYGNESTADLHGTPFKGSISRNTLRATTWNNLNASVFKNVRVKEGYTLQFSVSCQNVLNRQYLGTLDPEIDDVTFQDPRNSGGSVRTTRLGARFTF